MRSMPDSSPSRMSTSATSGCEAFDQLPALAGGAGGADHLDPRAVEQQLEPFAEGLVIFDQTRASRSDMRRLRGRKQRGNSA